MDFIVEVFKGKDNKWRWHILAKNGEILAVSQPYFSKWNATRAAKKVSPEYIVLE